jgi:hypothetical protein
MNICKCKVIELIDGIEADIYSHAHLQESLITQLGCNYGSVQMKIFIGREPGSAEEDSTTGSLR